MEKRILEKKALEIFEERLIAIDEFAHSDKANEYELDLLKKCLFEFLFNSHYRIANKIIEAIKSDNLKDLRIHLMDACDDIIFSSGIEGADNLDEMHEEIADLIKYYLKNS